MNQTVTINGKTHHLDATFELSGKTYRTDAETLKALGSLITTAIEAQDASAVAAVMFLGLEVGIIVEVQ